jgi:hypothetical protein
MEFCGGHTHAISRYGVADLLPPNVKMIHGPGCPVCVLPIGRVDLAIELALQRGVILCTYGDVLRVPASGGLSLLKAKARGADVRMIYSAADALDLARRYPQREVVFFAIGFETTTPPTALVIRQEEGGLRSYAHIGTETCDTPTHHQVEEQRLAFNAATGTFTVANASSSCLTIGEDKDPDSHAPALEVQACSAALSDRQAFVPQASGQLQLKSDASQCLDQDMSDHRVIVYGCHDPGSAGNQAWTIDATTQHVVSVANGLCMAVMPPA